MEKMSFLYQTARHVLNRHSLDELSRVGVVLPSRRAVFFFKQQLADLADRPFLAPDVWAIEDFVFVRTGLQPVDQVGLLFELFDVYRESDPAVQFERYTGWAATLLSDFDRVDQYLVPPRAVFEWVSEAKAITRWELDESWHASPGTAADRYFRLFEHLWPAYQGLRERLLAKGLAYRGMAYRYLAEKPYECLIEPNTHDFYYFAGFNALSKSEETFVTYLIGKNKAETLWDTDDYYMEHRGMEAGALLRDYKFDPDGRFGPPRTWKWQGSELATGEKMLQIIGVSNASMQPKVAGEVVRKWEEEDERGMKKFPSSLSSPSSLLKTAIVLGDENLLMPLLFSLDETVRDFNVTMGVSLRNSMLFTLVDAWFDAQRNLVEIRTREGEVKRIPKFSQRHVLRLLNHPFVRRYEAAQRDVREGEPPVRAALRAIETENRVFLDEKELLELGQHDELFRVLFTRWQDKPATALRQCYRLVDLLRGVYRHRDDALETEYLYLFFTLLKRLESMLEARRQELVGIRPFRALLFELIRQTSIPFSGEPVSDLQIMGMLETRALDFERVIVLSVNEGNLPSGKRVNSLIPFDAAQEFGLPTHAEQDAVMAYHFFRLLQRAKDVVLVYAEPTGEGQRAEKSRFLLQIEHELAKANRNIRLSFPKIEFQPADQSDRPEDEGKVWKNEAMLSFLRRDLAERGLFATHLNQYVQCSMKYYFGRVAGLREETDEPGENLGSDQFGVWLHKTLELIDRELTAQSPFVTAEALRKVRDEVPAWLEKTFGLVYPNLPFGQGVNQIQFLIARKLLTDFYDHQLANEKNFPIEIVGLEQQLSVDVTLDLDGQPFPIKIGGTLDRLDRTPDGTLRVIDYKTGKVEAKQVKVDDLETDLLDNRDKDKLRQLWLYKYLATKQLLAENGLQTLASSQAVVTGIYSFRNIKDGLFGEKSELVFEPGETAADFLSASERQLGKFVRQLLDEAEPFTRTTERKACEWCGFARLCGR
jgi:hypothetical protein